MPSAVRLRAATAYLAISAGLVNFAGLEFMLEAIKADFSMSADETIVVAQIAAGACLLVVFLSGALADRLGDRRVLAAASAIYVVGAALVGVSPNANALIVGLSLGGVGTISMGIVGVSVLGHTFPERGKRARAFGLFALIAPVVSIIVPLLAGVVVPHLGWRWVTLLWIAVGAATFVLTRRALPGDGHLPVRTELVTPSLAGVALSGFALTFSFIETNSRTDAHLVHGAMSAAVGMLALLALVIVMRRRPNSTLDIRSLRTRGTSSVFAAVFMVNGVNLFFFTYLFLQYRHHQSLLGTAAMLVVPQATAAFGAIMGGRLSAKWGSATVATAALLCAAVLSLGVFVVDANSSSWVPVLVLATAAVPIAAAVGPLTQSFIDQSPEDGVAATSSWRTSAANLGVAIGGVITGTIVFDDLDRDTARDAVAYGMQTDAFHLAGVLCALAYLVAAGLVVVHSRRASSVLRPSSASSAERLGRGR